MRSRPRPAASIRLTRRNSSTAGAVRLGGTFGVLGAGDEVDGLRGRVELIVGTRRVRGPRGGQRYRTRARAGHEGVGDARRVGGVHHEGPAVDGRAAGLLQRGGAPRRAGASWRRPGCAAPAVRGPRSARRPGRTGRRAVRCSAARTRTDDMGEGGDGRRVQDLHRLDGERHQGGVVAAFQRGDGLLGAVEQGGVQGEAAGVRGGAQGAEDLVVAEGDLLQDAEGLAIGDSAGAEVLVEPLGGDAVRAPGADACDVERLGARLRGRN